MIIISIFGLFGIFSFGFFVADFLLGRASHILERISVGFLLGTGIFTFIIFLLNWLFNVSFSLGYELLVLLALNLIAFLINIVIGKQQKVKEPFNYNLCFTCGFKKLTLVEKVFLGITLFLCAYSLIMNMYWPVADWDALALYDFRAKVFLVDKLVVPASLTNGYFLQYPLYTSLIHTFFYHLGFANPKFVYTLFYFYFLVIFFFSLRRHVNRDKAMFFTAFLALVPELITHSTMAYTNLPYVVFFCSGIFYLYEWIRFEKISFLILSGLLVGLSRWVRTTEPFWAIPLLVVVWVSLKNKRWKEIVYFFIPVYSLSRVWQVFVAHVAGLLPHSTATLAKANPALSYLSLVEKVTFSRFVEVGIYLYKNVFSVWGLILLIFILILILSVGQASRKKNDKIFLYITSLFLIFLYIGTIGFSMIYPGWQEIPESARRMSMVILPFLVYSISIYKW